MAYHWINNVNEKNRVIIGKDKPTGLLRIPGCEATHEMPRGREVVFLGKGYHNYAISPFGAIILGNDGVYDQELSRTKLLPDTEMPVIAPFVEYLQVKS